MRNGKNEVREVLEEGRTAPVLITGGAGFIGCNVAHRLLAAGQPAAAALAMAQREIAELHPTGMTDGAPFICLGAGFNAPGLLPAPELVPAAG